MVIRNLWLLAVGSTYYFLTVLRVNVITALEGGDLIQNDHVACLGRYIVGYKIRKTTLNSIFYDILPLTFLWLFTDSNQY